MFLLGSCVFQLAYLENHCLPLSYIIEFESAFVKNICFSCIRAKPFIFIQEIMFVGPALVQNLGFLCEICFLGSAFVQNLFGPT